MVRSRTECGTAFVSRGPSRAGGARDPLLLVHGVGLRLEAFAPQLEGLSGDRRVVALDLPGHGESDPLPAAARLPDFVDWLLRSLDELALGPVNIAGHSMGAMIALGSALTRPERVLRVALLNAVYRRSPEARAAVLARALEAEQGCIDVDAPIRRWFGDSPAAIRSPAGRSACEWLRCVSPGGYATAYRAFAEGDDVYAARLGELRMPALFLTGALDLNSSAEMSRAMAAATPGAVSVVIEGERHMSPLTAPAPTNEALSAWLARPARRPEVATP